MRMDELSTDGIATLLTRRDDSREPIPEAPSANTVGAVADGAKS